MDERPRGGESCLREGMEKLEVPVKAYEALISV